VSESFLVTYQTGGILYTMGMEYFHEWSRREVLRTTLSIWLV